MTVAVWLGYDNADGVRRTLGGGATGGGVAVPIFEPVIQAVWANVAPKTALAPPSPEARRQLSCKSVDLEFGEAKERGGKTISECFRVDGKGRIIDTQTVLVSRDGEHARRGRDDDDDDRAGAGSAPRLSIGMSRASARPAPVPAPTQWGFQQWGAWGAQSQWGQW